MNLKRRLVGICMAVIGSCGVAWGETLDLAGANRTLTSLSGYDSVVNSGGSATLTLNLSSDETFTGEMTGPVKLVKDGTGKFTINGSGFHGTSGFDIVKGIVVIGPNAGDRALGAEGANVTISDGGALDLNLPGTASNERTRITHDVILNIAGSGFNGSGALFSSAKVDNWQHKSLGRIRLTADATISVNGRMDIRGSNEKGYAELIGEGHTLTVTSANYGNLTICGATTTLKKIIVVNKGFASFEGTGGGLTLTENIELRDSAHLQFYGGIHASVLATPIVVTGNDTQIIAGNANQDHRQNITIAKGAKLTFLRVYSDHTHSYYGTITNHGTVNSQDDKVYYRGTIVNHGTWDFIWNPRGVEGCTIINDGTMYTANYQKTPYLNVKIDNTGFFGQKRTSENPDNSGWQTFNGTLTVLTNNFTYTIEGTRGLDFHPTTITAPEGKKVTVRAANAGNNNGIWTGAGASQMTSNVPLSFENLGGGDLVFRAYATDFPMAPSIDIEKASGSLLFHLHDQYRVAERTAVLDGSRYHFDASKVDTYFYGEQARTNTLNRSDIKLVNASWDLSRNMIVSPTASGNIIGSLVLGENTDLTVGSVMLSNFGASHVRLALQDDSSMTFSGDNARFLVKWNTTTNAVVMNGGTLNLPRDWKIETTDRSSSGRFLPYTGLDLTLGEADSTEANTINLANNATAKAYAALKGCGPLAISGDGDFVANARQQGRLAGDVTVSGSGVKNLSGASAFGGALTVEEGATAQIGISGTSAVKAALVGTSKSGPCGRRDPQVYEMLDETINYAGPFDLLSDNFDIVHSATVWNEDFSLSAGQGVVYEGEFYVPEAADYTFFGGWDNSIKLRIDGEDVLESVGFDTNDVARVTLAEGWHPFRLAVHNMGGDGCGSTIQSKSKSSALQKHRYIGTSCPADWQTSETWDDVTVVGGTRVMNNYGDDSHQNATLLKSLNDWSGFFYVKPEQAGKWEIHCCYDDRMFFTIDDDYRTESTYAPVVTNTYTIAAGWHTFHARGADTGGGHGGGWRNGDMAVSVVLPGKTDAVAFDERNFGMRHTMDDGEFLAATQPMGIGWTTATLSADKERKAENYTKFSPQTVKMRPLAKTYGSSVRWKHRAIGGTCPNDWQTTETWDSVAVTNSFSGINEYNGWTGVKESLNEWTGYFYVEAKNAGDWEVQACHDDKVAFRIDDTYKTEATYNPVVTNHVTLTEGWHRFWIRCWDTGGGYGAGVRNDNKTLRIKRPGDADYVAFDERAFKVRASMELATAEALETALLRPGLYGGATVKAGAMLANEVPYGACPVESTLAVEPGATLKGRYTLGAEGSLVVKSAGGRVKSLASEGTALPLLTAAMFASGGSLVVDFAARPAHTKIVVGPADDSLAALSKSELAAVVKGVVNGDAATMSDFEPKVVGEQLILVNHAADGFAIVIH